MKQITQQGWNETSKDYKSIKQGQKYILYLDSKTGTTLGPCKVIDEKNDYLEWESGEVSRYTYQALEQYINGLENQMNHVIKSLENQTSPDKELIKIIRKNASDFRSTWNHILKLDDKKRVNEIKEKINTFYYKLKV
ncbi:hypothetical protein MZM54_00265 [[Brevibacterium] frigoritolerans]|nr:hypothetical protein [Peribacillus frigoritolerans]